MFSERFGVVDRKSELEELAEIQRSADQIRQMFNLDGWTRHVAPYLDSYRDEVIAQLAAAPGKGEDYATRAARDTFLRGCLEGQQALLGFLASILSAETRALEDVDESVGDESDEADEDTPRSWRFG